MKRFLVLMLAAVVVSSCGGGEGPLVVYSGRTENLVGPLFEDFTESTGTEVEVRYSPSADLALIVEREGDRSPADVFISQSPGAIGVVAGGGLVMLSTMKELPATLLLSPLGFDTLATRIWGASTDGFLAETGVASLTLVALSAVFTWMPILRPFSPAAPEASGT